MPFLLIIIGVLMIVAGFQANEKALMSQFWSDGKAFTPWFFVILIVGAIGFNRELRGASNLFLCLVVIAFLLTKQGTNSTTVLKQFNQLIQGAKQ